MALPALIIKAPVGGIETTLPFSATIVAVDTSLGAATIILPKIDALASYLMARLGNSVVPPQIVIYDLGRKASINNITIIANLGDTIASGTVILNKNGASTIISLSGNSWSAVSNQTIIASPFEFYLDGKAPNGGDGSFGNPFNTITKLNNYVLSLDPNKSYVGLVAPYDLGYGSEVVGDLLISPNLSLVGITPQNTGFGNNFKLIAPANPNGIVNQYRNVAFNGVFTVDLSLASFAAITFLDGAFNIDRIDNNLSGFVVLSGGIGTTTVGGNVVMQNGIMFGDITVSDGANLFSTNALVLGGKFKLNGNCILKTFSTQNPSDGYVDGTVDGSGTPTWFSDAASVGGTANSIPPQTSVTYSGTLNRIIY